MNDHDVETRIFTDSELSPLCSLFRRPPPRRGRCRPFWRDGWNCFDFVVVALSLVALGPIAMPVNVVSRMFECSHEFAPRAHARLE